MSPPVVVHGMMPSAPCRIVTMTLEVLGVEYEFKVCDLMKGEAKTPEFLKINKQHNIPTIVDGDFAMNESRASAAYLVNAYSKGDSKATNLYPTEAKVRARVDQFMYFDMGQLYKAFGECVYPIMFNKSDDQGTKTVPDDKLAKLHEVCGWVEEYVEETGYAAGTENLTLADICWVASLSTILATDAVFPVLKVAEKFPGLKDYMEKMKKQIPNYEKANGEGAAAFAQWFKSKL